MNNIVLEQIYKKENSRLKVYEYKTNTNYHIKVTTFGGDTHIKASLDSNIFLLEAPSVLYTCKENGELVFPTSSIILTDRDLFLDCVKQALLIDEFIKEHFNELAKGEINFRQDEVER